MSACILGEKRTAWIIPLSIFRITGEKQWCTEVGLPAPAVRVVSRPLTKTRIQGFFHQLAAFPLTTPGKNDSGDSGLLMSSSSTEDAMLFMNHFKVGMLTLAFPRPLLSKGHGIY